MSDEVLMHIRPQNEFEKLIWERQMNKGLSAQLRGQRRINEKLVEAGKAQQEAHKEEMAQLIKMLQTSNVGQLVAKNRKISIQLEHTKIKLKNTKRSNEELMEQVIANKKELVHDNIEEGAG